jgi:DNA-directed RNA polymerase specialized sigma24 family protein
MGEVDTGLAGVPEPRSDESRDAESPSDQRRGGIHRATGGASCALIRLALTFVADHAAAEEVVQDTWIGVLRGAGVRGPGVAQHLGERVAYPIDRIRKARLVQDTVGDVPIGLVARTNARCRSSSSIAAWTAGRRASLSSDDAPARLPDEDSRLPLSSLWNVLHPDCTTLVSSERI